MTGTGLGSALPRALGDGEVHVWPVVRTGDDEPVARVLAGYGGGDSVTIERGAGKPRLVGARRDLRFSVSHAGGLTLVAVAAGREVGIDVERLGRRRWLSLPGHALTPAERRSLDALSGAAREAAFLRLWTRKEAVLKAAGVGLAVDPARVEVSGPAEPPAVLDVPASIGPAARWALFELAVPGHVTAVAVECPGSRVFMRAEPPRRAGPLTKSLPLRDLRLTGAL
jgi:phosphopantetheinyl transferase